MWQSIDAGGHGRWQEVHRQYACTLGHWDSPVDLQVFVRNNRSAATQACPHALIVCVHLSLLHSNMPIDTPERQFYSCTGLRCVSCSIFTVVARLRGPPILGPDTASTIVETVSTHSAIQLKLTAPHYGIEPSPDYGLSAPTGPP